MKLEQERNGNSLLIKIEGKVTAITAEELKKTIESSVDDDVDTLIFDISDMEYTSSAGLRVLLMAQDMMDDRNGSMEVVGASEMVMDTFRETGFDSFLTLKKA